jgi:hypothetical protein
VHTPPAIQIKLDLVEVDVWVLRHFIVDKEVHENICSWIPDLVSSRAMVSQYYKTIDLYWHIKALMGKVMVERNEAHKEILLQIDDVQLQIKLVDHKLNLLVVKIVGLDFSKLDYSQPQVLVVDGHLLLI